MGIAELFDRIYIVNLPERTDRRREMEDQLVKVGLGGHPRVMFFPAIRPNAAGEFPSIGARGCFSSHLAILQDAAQQGLQRILILEDDLDFSRDFNARIGALCARLQQSDWGVFYGGYELLQPLAGPDAEIQSMAAEAAVRTTHFIAFQAPVMERAAAYLQAMLARPGGASGRRADACRRRLFMVPAATSGNAHPDCRAGTGLSAQFENRYSPVVVDRPYAIAARCGEPGTQTQEPPALVARLTGHGRRRGLDGRSHVSGSSR